MTRSKITGVDIFNRLPCRIARGCDASVLVHCNDCEVVGIAAKAMVLCVKRTLDKEKLHIFKTDAKGNVMYDPDTDTALFLDESDPMFIPPRVEQWYFYREPFVLPDTSLSEMIAPSALVMLAPSSRVTFSEFTQ